MLMGTVTLCLTDDNGAKHTFTLTQMNKMPKSPVNILSTRVLNQNFQIKMVLIDKVQELPQCLMIILFLGIMVNFARLTRLTILAFQNCFFNSGYSQLQSFTTFLQPYHDNMVHWVFVPESKNKAFA
jgi:hypothetical protein